MGINWSYEELKFFEDNREELNSGDLDRIGKAIKGFSSYWGRIRVGLAIARLLNIKVITSPDKTLSHWYIYIPFGETLQGLGLIPRPESLFETLKEVLSKAKLTEWDPNDFIK